MLHYIKTDGAEEGTRTLKPLRALPPEDSASTNFATSAIILWLLYNNLMQIQVFVPEPWSEHELIDSGNGRRLERFGKYVVDRPDPSVIWPKGNVKLWGKVDAYYNNDNKQWQLSPKLPESWTLKYQDLTIKVRPTPFKHLGIFPEQAVNWRFIEEVVKKAGREGTLAGLTTNSRRIVKILNLFGYTGVASLAAAQAGIFVTHVDASKPALTWASENAKLSKIPDGQIRWILDDARKFVQREARRGSFYDGIIMDPPVFGHGPTGSAWDFNHDFPELLANCTKILTPDPLFVIVNAYAVSLSALSLGNALTAVTTGLNGRVEVGELALQESNQGRIFSTGILARWSK